eukprot:11215916-Lingulodinium_polyedra.AAC.1
MLYGSCSSAVRQRFICEFKNCSISDDNLLGGCPYAVRVLFRGCAYAVRLLHGGFVHVVRMLRGCC